MIRLGIIGTGRIAGRFFFETKVVEGVCVTAVLNPRKTSAERFAKDCGIPLATDSEEQFAEQIDAAYIASPHATHVAYARHMLEEGKHVLCEKPMALSRRDAEKLCSLAESKGLVLLEAEKTAWSPGFLAMEKAVQSGGIGEIRDVEAAFTRLTSTDVREYLDAEYGGSFTEFGSYPLLPIFRFLGTDVREMDFQSLPAPNGVDSYTKAHFTFDHGFATARTGLGVKSEGALLISGTKGYLLAPSPWWLPKYFELRFEDPNRIERFSFPFEGFGLRYEIRAFEEMIRKGAGVSPREKAETLARAEVMERFLAGRKRRNPLSEAEKKKVGIWAHRGCSFRYPENTIPAFLHAAALPGIAGVELDVQRTKDGALVVIHDETVDRTREGSGNVRDFTLSELQRLPVRASGGEVPFSLEIPTLQQVFDALKPYCEEKGLKINIELKTGVVRYEGIEGEVLKLVRESHMEEAVIYSSFLPDSLRILKELDPSVRTGMLAGTLAECVCEGEQAGTDDWHPCVSGLQEDPGREKEGRRIRAWNCTEPLFGSGRTVPDMDLRDYAAFGVTDLFTNIPERYLF